MSRVRIERRSLYVKIGSMPSLLCFYKPKVRNWKCEHFHVIENGVNVDNPTDKFTFSRRFSHQKWLWSVIKRPKFKTNSSEAWQTQYRNYRHKETDTYLSWGQETAYFLTSYKFLKLLDHHSLEQVKTVLPRCLVCMFTFQLRLKDIGSSRWPDIYRLRARATGQGSFHDLRLQFSILVSKSG